MIHLELKVLVVDSLCPLMERLGAVLVEKGAQDSDMARLGLCIALGTKQWELVQEVLGCDRQEAERLRAEIHGLIEKVMMSEGGEHAFSV